MAMTRANMSKQVNNPPAKYKGFSKLPEAVQQKMDPELAKTYKFGKLVRAKSKAKGGIKIRGAGAATKGTMARGPMG